MSYYSQFGEDRWIQENLNPPDASLFCEVGAFDGVQSSNTLHFEEDKSWTGLLIEPNPRQWEKCRVNRKAPSLCIAISDAQIGDHTFWINEEDEGQSNGMGHGDKITPITQLYTRLTELWHCFHVRPPYLLSIDTEGTEIDVWRSARDLRPTIVIMEYLTWGMEPRDHRIIEGMTLEGYQLRHQTEANLIFTI